MNSIITTLINLGNRKSHFPSLLKGVCDGTMSDRQKVSRFCFLNFRRTRSAALDRSGKHFYIEMAIQFQQTTTV